MEGDRIALIWSSGGSGSGYQVAPRLVLTASHVLGESQEATVWIGGTRSWSAKVAWQSAKELDVCLLRLVTPNGPTDRVERERVRFAAAPLRTSVQWHGGGFPRAMVEPTTGERESVGVHGDITAAGGMVRQVLELTVKHPPRSEDDWMGLSGAAVLVESRVVGVVTQMLPKLEGRAHATRIERVLETLPRELKKELSGKRALPRQPVDLQRLWVAIAAALLGFLSVVLLSHGYGPMVSNTRLWWMTLRQQVAPLVTSDRLRIVLIDEASERALKNVREAETELGSFGTSWRVLFARMVDRLADARAAVIVFDVAFQDEPATAIESAGTSALAASLARAVTRGTKVVLTAVARDPNGQPRLASAIRTAMESTGSDPRCVIAHPCMGKPERGPSVLLLPLVLVDSSPSFSLSVCAYAQAEKTLPIWIRGSNQLVLGKSLGVPISFSGSESGASVAKCGMARAETAAVHRVVAPFAVDLSRSSPRVLSFESLVTGDLAAKDLPNVAGRIVLVGQRDVLPDIVLGDSAPNSSPLWGVSAHAAAIDALLQHNGLVTFISPPLQMAWVATACLLVFVLRMRLSRHPRWARVVGFWVVAATDVALSAYLARVHGYMTDASSHVFAMALAYLFAVRTHAKRGIAS